MPVNRIPTMSLSEFAGRLSKYEKVASSKERREDRLNHQDDTPYYMCVVQEMFMDLIQRLEKLERLLDVSPDEDEK